MNEQGTFTKGIYDFEDPSGSLMAVRIPPAGPAALYDGTRIIVKPTQQAIFVYNGQIADVLGPGNHEVKTGNTPILTSLSNWKYGGSSPLEAEIWFFSHSAFSGRKWGTGQPILVNMSDVGPLPLRAHGNYNVKIDQPVNFYEKMIGEKTAVDVSELDDFIQGQIIACLPEALKLIKSSKDINSVQDAVSEKLEDLVNKKFDSVGISLWETQILSLSPPQEVLQALDEKASMNIIGDPKQYMLYKMANRLDHLKEGSGGADPAQLMMTMMMTKSFTGAEPNPPASSVNPRGSERECPACHSKNLAEAKFCGQCGGRLA